MRRFLLLPFALLGLFVIIESDALAFVGGPAMPVSAAVSDGLVIIGRPLTPMSYAGVARRTVRRSAYYY